MTEEQIAAIAKGYADRWRKCIGVEGGDWDILEAEVKVLLSDAILAERWETLILIRGWWNESRRSRRGELQVSDIVDRLEERAGHDHLIEESQ